MASSRATSRIQMLIAVFLLSDGGTKQTFMVQAQEADSEAPSFSARPSMIPTASLNPSESPSESSENPSPAPTVYVPTVSISPSEPPSTSPTLSPSITTNPSTLITTEDTEEGTDEETQKRYCRNAPGWAAPATYMHDDPAGGQQWVHGIFDCDHPSITCNRVSRIGPAATGCCKCRPECCGFCSKPYGDDITFPGDPCNLNADDDIRNISPNGPTMTEEEDGPMEGIDVLRFIFSAMGITFCVIAGLLAIRNQQNRELRDARRVMAERRRLQREREQEEGRRNAASVQDMNARYEQIVTAFLFQTVNSDKTNIAAASIRKDKGATDSRADEEAVNEEEDDPSNRTVLPWLKLAPKDECVICLENYNVGETICVPIRKECNHVFHEECIVEWLKTHSDCPLCRIKIIGD